MEKEVSFMVFCSVEPYVGMSTGEAWDLYLVKVKGKFQSELRDYDFL
jgi:hypothetical protein